MNLIKFLKSSNALFLIDIISLFIMPTVISILGINNTWNEQLWASVNGTNTWLNRCSWSEARRSFNFLASQLFHYFSAALLSLGYRSLTVLSTVTLKHSDMRWCSFLPFKNIYINHEIIVKSLNLSPCGEQSFGSELQMIPYRVNQVRRLYDFVSVVELLKYKFKDRILYHLL